MKNQIAFKFKTHGGPRRGAGRPRARKNDPVHSARARLDSKSPAHVTLRFAPDVPNLRCESFLLEFTRAIGKAKAKGLAVTQFAIESNHIHILVEVESNHALTRGLLSLQGCITWGLRRIFGYAGEVFAGRFHLHKISTPREMKNALLYVIFNHAKHCGAGRFADLFSSAFAFVELGEFTRCRSKAPRWQNEIDRVLSAPRSWLQSRGWRRAT